MAAGNDGPGTAYDVTVSAVLSRAIVGLLSQQKTMIGVRGDMLVSTAADSSYRLFGAAPTTASANTRNSSSVAVPVISTRERSSSNAVASCLAFSTVVMASSTTEILVADRRAARTSANARRPISPVLTPGPNARTGACSRV